MADSTAPRHATASAALAIIAPMAPMRPTPCHPVLARARQIAPAAALTLAALTLALTAAGCAKPLLSPEDERSPFDRFDALRAQYSPQYIEDEYGRQKPNLRGRLTPRE